MTRERLHKVMANCGVGSRRKCEEIIAQGRVEVDGTIVDKPGSLVDIEEQTLRCDGQRLRPPPRLYYLLNKPRGVICSQTTRAGTRRAVDYAPARARDHRLFTIGRLDVDSDGALILTNDGELCHLVSHPRFGIRKTYQVDVVGLPTPETMQRMRKGVWLSEGRTGEVDVRLAHRGRDRSELHFTLQEGKRREIRRICARFGHEVKRLTRISVGPVQLGLLRPGQVRKLTDEEVAALRDAAKVVIRLGAPKRPGLSTGRSKPGRSRSSQDRSGRGKPGGRKPGGRKTGGRKTGRRKSVASKPRARTSGSRKAARAKPERGGKKPARAKPGRGGKKPARAKPERRAKGPRGGKPPRGGKRKRRP